MELKCQLSLTCVRIHSYKVHTKLFHISTKELLKKPNIAVSTNSFLNVITSLWNVEWPNILVIVRFFPTVSTIWGRVVMIVEALGNQRIPQGQLVILIIKFPINTSYAALISRPLTLRWHKFQFIGKFSIINFYFL